MVVVGTSQTHLLCVYVEIGIGIVPFADCDYPRSLKKLMVPTSDYSVDSMLITGSVLYVRRYDTPPTVLQLNRLT